MAATATSVHSASRRPRAMAAQMAPSALVASRRFFTAIADSSSSLGGLKRAARLYTLCTDPLNGLIGPIFGLDASFRIPEQDLGTFGASPAARALRVDAELATFLNGACDDAGASPAALAALPASLRTLVALRFFALNAGIVPHAAEHLQIGLETVLGEDGYDDCADDRDAAVDTCTMAMDILCDTLPSGRDFQATVDALLAGNAVPDHAAERIEWMTDDCICPELDDWLYDVEQADDDMDEDEDEDEE